jgi:type II secretory pathway component PulM
MPVWTQIIIGIAGFVVALGVIWKKVVSPLARLITTTEKILPLLVMLTEVFEKNPNALKVLGEIAAQFKTDSGSSLRDVVNRLEQAALDNRKAVVAAAEAADVLKIGVEASRLVSDQDRAMVRRLEILLDRLGVKVDEGAATGMRIERAAGHVAQDLAASHRRADETEGGEPGAAADAAAQQTVRERQLDG